MADIIPLGMPQDLIAMEYRIAAGEDADEIPGIERLWLYRFNRDAEAFAEDHRRFFDWLEKQPK
jgi:hypothetical protein